MTGTVSMFLFVFTIAAVVAYFASKKSVKIIAILIIGGLLFDTTFGAGTLDKLSDAVQGTDNIRAEVTEK
jgi:hypothetical protein